MSRFLYFIALVVVFGFFMSRKNRKVLAAKWAGTVTEIRHQRKAVVRDEDRHNDDWVTISYRKDDGFDDKLKIRMRVMREFFKGIKTGDRLIKKPGEYLPRLESAENVQPVEAA